MSKDKDPITALSRVRSSMEAAKKDLRALKALHPRYLRYSWSEDDYGIKKSDEGFTAYLTYTR